MNPEDWLAHKTPAESQLRDEGIVVLGIEQPDGVYVGAPRGPTQILPGDILLLYGRIPVLASLDQRGKDSTGERAHEESVIEQRQIVKAEEQERQQTLEDDKQLKELSL